MKGAIEYYVLMLLFLLMVLLGFQIVGCFRTLQEAQLQREMAVMVIERYDAYGPDVMQHIANSALCQQCETRVYEEEDQLWLEIKTVLRIPVLDYEKQVVLKSIPNIKHVGS